jgi:uncharacterized protein YecE (DUF72 family)
VEGRIRIGTQGWNYRDWVGPFYPEGARPADYLPLYARAFGTVEVDSTFYGIPAVRTVRGWAERTPDGFVFALKMPAEVTLERGLAGEAARDAALRFLDVARELREAHGAALALSDGRWIPRETMTSLAARATAPFHYVRWMGPDRAITTFSRVLHDRAAELGAWAEALRGAAARGVEVYGYANNHFAGHSPATAREVQRLLGVPPVDPRRIGDQTSLF